MTLTGISRHLGCTEGQLYTMATGSAFAVLLALAGSHATLDAGLPLGSVGAPPVTVVAPATTPPVVAPSPLGPLPLPAPGAGSFFGGRLTPTEQPVPTPAASVPVGLPAGPALLAMIGSPGAPAGLAVGPDGHVFVATDNGTAQGVSGPSKVFEFDAAGRQLRDVTIGGQPKGHPYGLWGLAVSPTDGAVFVSDVDSARVIRIDAVTGAQRIAVRIPDVQPCPLVLNAAPCEPGLTDHPPTLSALAFNPAGDLFIADAGQATIWRWTAGQASPAQWYSSTDLATGDGPAGLAFTSTGSLLFSAGTTLDTSNVNAGGLYSLAVAADGSAGARTLLAGFASGDRPGAVAADPFGPVYLVLRGSGSIVSLDSGAVKPFSTAGSPVPLDGPAGLAFRDGRLLVSNGSPSNNASHWAVLVFPGVAA
jgi:hypothetical protein